MVTHFFPPKVLQLHNRYSWQGLFNTWEAKVQKFIFCIKNIVDYLKHLPPFGKNQWLPYDETINLIKFALTHKWNKELPVHGLKFTSKSINKLIDLCDSLNMAVGIFNDKVDGKIQTKKTSSLVKDTNQTHQLQKKIGSNQVCETLRILPK